MSTTPVPRWRRALSILILVATLAAILATILLLLPFRIGAGRPEVPAEESPARQGCADPPPGERAE